MLYSPHDTPHGARRRGFCSNRRRYGRSGAGVDARRGRSKAARHRSQGPRDPSRWPGLNLLTRQAHDRKDHARQNELEGEFDELVGQAAHLCGEASDIRAATMEGVYCKVRLIEIDGGDPEELAMSIVDDLQAWKGLTLEISGTRADAEALR